MEKVKSKKKKASRVRERFFRTFKSQKSYKDSEELRSGEELLCEFKDALTHNLIVDETDNCSS